MADGTNDEDRRRSPARTDDLNDKWSAWETFTKWSRATSRSPQCAAVDVVIRSSRTGRLPRFQSAGVISQSAVKGRHHSLFPVLRVARSGSTMSAYARRRRRPIAQTTACLCCAQSTSASPGALGQRCAIGRPSRLPQRRPSHRAWIAPLQKPKARVYAGQSSGVKSYQTAARLMSPTAVLIAVGMFIPSLPGWWILVFLQ